MVAAPVLTAAPRTVPAPEPFDAADRHVLQEVSLRAELLSRKLELLRVIGAEGNAAELRKLEGLLALVARQIDELLAT